MYALLVAATKDGTWLQFAQSAPHLTQAFLEELGLADEVREPKWAGFPDLPTPELRQEWWDTMLARVGERTLAEWEAVFDRNSNVFGEQFRTPDEALAHPQLVHEGRVVTVDDPDLGPVRQPSTLVHAGRRPLTEIRRAPRLDEHAAEIRLLAAPSTQEQGESPLPLESNGPSRLSIPPPRACPLAGVTVLELGGMFAAPFGATVLADLGARVIKVEPLDGDTIRGIMAFPEAGGGKVLQGKESIALDIRTPEGLAIVREIARRCDVVLQCYRAGVAARIGIDEAALKAVNPDLVYLNAPGYGIDGPYGGKPAYAPSIGAASGVSLTDAPLGGARPETHEQLLSGARNLRAGGTVPAVQSDGIAALGVASGLLLGLYAKQRGIALTDLTTTMLGSCTQALIGRNTGYQGRPPLSRVDDEFRGLGPLYRLYRAADGWVFLAAPGRGGVARARGGADVATRAWMTRASPPRPAARPTPTRWPSARSHLRDPGQGRLGSGADRTRRRLRRRRAGERRVADAGRRVLPGRLRGRRGQPDLRLPPPPGPAGPLLPVRDQGGRGLPAGPAHRRAAARARLRRRTDRRPAQAGRGPVKEGTCPSRFPTT